MATIASTKALNERGRATTIVHSWAALANGDDGAPIQLPFLSDRSVQVSGTFGVGGNVRIEGSLDGVNYAVLTDPQGNNLDLSSAKIESVMEVVQFIRPRVTAGDGTTSVNVTILTVGAV
jgi:hypothetical protein